ncbi:hypothetical protein ACHQM5_016528 [Ranunculus cassubicifolius]
MSHLPQELTKNSSSTHVSKLYRNFEGLNMINFGRQVQRYDYNTGSFYHDPHGVGIEFRAHNEDESGITSPPLWHTSPPKSPQNETTPLSSHAYNHHHYRSLSPKSRAQAIERGREELMEMVKNMPESTYELSLKDIVEHSRNQGFPQTSNTVVEETEADKSSVKSGGKNRTNKKKKKTDPGHVSRSGSMNGSSRNGGNGSFLLKMFFPIPPGSNRKRSSSPNGTRVSPRPVETEKFADKDWWAKRFPNESSNSGSSGSSDSTRSNKRNKDDYVPGCWSFFQRK